MHKNMQQAVKKTKNPVIKNNDGSLVNELVKNKALYILALPAILYFLVFAYLPMVGIIIAFKDYNVMDGIFGSKFMTPLFKNFEFLVTSNDLPRITFNTLYLNVLFIVFGMASQVGISILLNEIRSKIFKKVSQGLLLLPYFISWVIIGVIAFYIFGTESGFLNVIMKSLGLVPIEWYNSPQYWPAILTLIYMWKWIGYGSIIYLSAIVGIDQEIYESAQIDGCNRWQVIRHITLPLLIPTMIILFLLALGRIFYGDFGMVLNVVRSNIMLFDTTNIIDTYVYRALMGAGSAGSYGNFGMASAAGFLQSLMGFFTIIIANKVVNKIEKDYALF